jgi:hypothetical protein
MQSDSSYGTDTGDAQEKVQVHSELDAKTACKGMKSLTKFTIIATAILIVSYQSFRSRRKAVSLKFLTYVKLPRLRRPDP